MNFIDALQSEDTYTENGMTTNSSTLNECVNLFQSYPIAIIDIVCPHKGRPYIGIEICHKNPVSLEKIDKLRKFGVDNLIEIDADWILNQTKIPSQLKYKRLI